MNVFRNTLRFGKHFSLISINYFIDYLTYVKYSKYTNVFKDKSKEQLICEILKASHSLEKGLSFRSPRVGFGLDKVKYLLKCLDEYVNNHGIDKYPIYAFKVLQQYYNLNSSHLPNKVSDKISYFLNKFNRQINDSKHITGGVIELPEGEDLFIQNNVANNLIEKRFSIRDFTDQEISMCNIDAAIKIAQKAPSACNRQPIKVYVVSEREKIDQLLSYQNGNRGFGDRINKLLILTSNLDYYGSANERNLAYIDCGIFSMALILALNSLQIGSCALNWSADFKQDKAMKKAANIPSNELIGLLIGVGYAPSKVKVPVSWRKPIEDIRVHL